MNSIIIADALDGLKALPSGIADTCVTSPPYYRLRDYGIDGQIGLEKNPQEYINKLVGIFREVRRVLKDDGTLWLNIADSYAGSGKGTWTNTNEQFNGIKVKDLIGIPWMLAFALRADGWYLRQDIIWQKPNAMPESVKDRCTSSYEHIFLLSKSKRYYFDMPAIKEPCVGFDKSPPRGSRGALTPNAGRRKGNNKSFRGGGVYTCNRSFDNSTADVSKATVGNCPNDTGLRNKRDIWTVATKGYNGAHFATYPPKLIEPCILAGSKVGGTVLDPFLGSGTTAEVANKLCRDCIGIELNPAYFNLIKARLERVKSARTGGQAESGAVRYR